jgi:NADPH:quinone reductase-like Zn-dependent oxidoreductase
MQAITVSERDAGVAGLSLVDLPYPQAADNEVVVRVHAAGFTPGELTLDEQIHCGTRLAAHLDRSRGS